jgi:hypothetical protein
MVQSFYKRAQSPANRERLQGGVFQPISFKALLGSVYPWTHKSKFWSFGVQFLAEAQVISPAIFVSEASVFKRLASEKKLSPQQLYPYIVPNNIMNMTHPLAQLPPHTCKHSKKAAALPEPPPTPVAAPPQGSRLCPPAPTTGARAADMGPGQPLHCSSLSTAWGTLL